MSFNYLILIAEEENLSSVRMLTSYIFVGHQGSAFIRQKWNISEYGNIYLK